MSDGSHIACLIMALAHKICPELLKENRLFWLKAPLFKVTKSGKNYYYYSDDEMREGVKGETIRFKGLGQMSPKDVEESMFSDSQRLEQLTYSEEGVTLLEQLMGEDVSYRKEFIFSEIDFERYGEI